MHNFPIWSVRTQTHILSHLALPNDSFKRFRSQFIALNMITATTKTTKCVVSIVFNQFLFFEKKKLYAFPFKFDDIYRKPFFSSLLAFSMSLYSIFCHIGSAKYRLQSIYLDNVAWNMTKPISVTDINYGLIVLQTLCFGCCRCCCCSFHLTQHTSPSISLFPPMGSYSQEAPAVSVRLFISEKSLNLFHIMHCRWPIGRCFDSSNNFVFWWSSRTAQISRKHLLGCFVGRHMSFVGHGNDGAIYMVPNVQLFSIISTKKKFERVNWMSWIISTNAGKSNDFIIPKRFLPVYEASWWFTIWVRIWSERVKCIIRIIWWIYCFVCQKIQMKEKRQKLQELTLNEWKEEICTLIEWVEERDV